MYIHIIFIFFILFWILNIPCNCCKHKSITTTPCIGYSTSTRPTTKTIATRRIITNPTSGNPENPRPQSQTPSNINKTLDKYYNFTTSPFTQNGLYSITGAYMLFDPHDLLNRTALYNFPIEYTKKSILLENDILDVGKKVMYLKSKGNMIGAYMTISSLEDVREDVHLLGLQEGVDYLEYRILPTGKEFLPAGEQPTEAYTNFMKTRLSQIKRSGFDFVQLGVFDPFSIFNYQEPEEYNINSTITWNGYQLFLLDILAYAKQLELKICLSEFPRIFENNVHIIAPFVDFIHIFTIDPRAFIKPPSEYIYHFQQTPIFLNTCIKNQVIPYFVYNTEWPVQSILYETSTLVETKYYEPDTSIVVCNRYIDWCFSPQRDWITPLLKTPNVSITILPPFLPLLPIPQLSPPKYYTMTPPIILPPIQDQKTMIPLL